MARAANEPTQQDEQKQSALGGMVWGVFSFGSTVMATKLATTMASKGWKLATGRSVPVKGDYDNEKTRDVVAYTAVSGMLMGAMKVAAERKAAEYFRQSTGHLPKGLVHTRLTRREKKQHKKLERAKAKAEQGIKNLTR
ncbi:MAG TPA: DUF4235 domain-containing protein [Intrasporangium sp.]|uniref:DUF4235 domain-containing protein n=1 Tax=Intrasporangium sp. TaxID=1925024 RepID=UPI002B48F9DB|nr:DUF4235 domain-containing protein [Intrasporangium sp.]HKX65892.1 DUF4235 domain-containing protein [Intrasporangium sp.]